MATFVFKVFQLAIRTAAKPLAIRFQQYVLDHATLRPRVLKFAQGLRTVEFALTKLAEGKPADISRGQKFLATLDDESLLDLAGKFVSEGFILCVGVGVIYWDYDRGVKRDALKAQKENEYRTGVNERFLKFEKELKDYKARDQAIFQAINERQRVLEGRCKIIEEERKHQQEKAWWRVV